jgi:hypothetical protein
MSPTYLLRFWAIDVRWAFGRHEIIFNSQIANACDSERKALREIAKEEKRPLFPIRYASRFFLG